MVDFLYLIKMDEINYQALERFKYSIESVLNNTYKAIRICIADISENPLEGYLTEIIPVDFMYVYKKKSNPYNRSYNINLGVRHLIESNSFFISDIDIIYSKDHIERHIKQNQYQIIVPCVHRIKKGLWCSDFNRLVKYGIAGTELTSGNCYCSTDIFIKLNGYDEEYIGFGGEDDDFYIRAMKICKLTFPRLPNFDKRFAIAHLWHERFVKDWKTFEKHLNANRTRLAQRQRLLSSRKINYNSVNSKGWGL